MKKIIGFVLLLFFSVILIGCDMTYRVVFYENDDVTTHQDITEGNQCSSYIPQKDGYIFLGWYTEDDQIFDFSTPITKNINLYAYYELIEWNVTFVYDEQDSSKNVIQKVSHQYKATLPTTPVKDDYLFMGWTYQGEAFDFNTSITSDITVVAKYVLDSSYKPMIYISFNSIGGGEFNRIQVQRLSTIQNFPIPEKEGYQFIGWFNGDTEYTNETVIREIEDFTLTAKYTNKE